MPSQYRLDVDNRAITELDNVTLSPKGLVRREPWRKSFSGKLAWPYGSDHSKPAGC